jgi:hypothetical protein
MAHGSSVMRPLSSGIFSADKPAVETCNLMGRAFRLRTSLPHAEARGLALIGFPISSAKFWGLRNYALFHNGF